MHNRRKSYRTKEDRRKAIERTKRGWQTRRENGTDKWGSDDRPPERLPAGQYLGTLRWMDTSGAVTQCVVRQGARANQIRIGQTECGWDYLFKRMRRNLSKPKKILR